MRVQDTGANTHIINSRNTPHTNTQHTQNAAHKHATHTKRDIPHNTHNTHHAQHNMQVLDTGANTNTINAAVAAELGLQQVDTHEN